MFYPYLEGFHNWRLYLLYWCTVIYSAVAILAQVTFHIIWGIEGKGWIVAHSWWAKLVGFARYLNDSICCIDFCCVHVHVSAHIHEYICLYMPPMQAISGLHLIMTVDAGTSLGNHHLLSIFLSYSYLLLSFLWLKSLEAGSIKIHVGSTSPLTLSK